MINVLLFTSRNCSPCKIFKPILKDFMVDSIDYDLNFSEYSSEKEEDESLFKNYGIRNVPALVVYNDSNSKNKIYTHFGAKRKTELVDIFSIFGEIDEH